MAAPLDPVDALLIIDMQNSFCHPDGVMYDALGQPLFGGSTRPSRRQRQRSLRHGLRRYQSCSPATSTAPGTWTSAPSSPSSALARTWDADIIDDLELSPSDLVVDKARLDAFYNTSLDTLLRSMGIARIAVAGVITNACVETSTRAAAMRDYEVTVLSDCTTSGQEQHRAMSLECLEAYHIASVHPFSAELFTR